MFAFRHANKKLFGLLKEQIQVTCHLDIIIDVTATQTRIEKRDCQQLH